MRYANVDIPIIIYYPCVHTIVYMPVTCPIKLTCSTKKLIKEQSLTFDENGKATETYNSIIRRAIELLSEQKKKKVDVSKL